MRRGLVEFAVGNVNTESIVRLQEACALLQRRKTPYAVWALCIPNMAQPRANGAHRALAARICRQLGRAAGAGVSVHALGGNEFVLLMPGLSGYALQRQRAQTFLARNAAGHLNGDGLRLRCHLAISASSGHEDARELIEWARIHARRMPGRHPDGQPSFRFAGAPGAVGGCEKMTA